MLCEWRVAWNLCDSVPGSKSMKVPTSTCLLGDDKPRCDTNKLAYYNNKLTYGTKTRLYDIYKPHNMMLQVLVPIFERLIKLIYLLI